MRFSYCEKFGLTAHKRQERLALLDLSDADIRTGIRLHQEIISPNISRLFESFYDKLLSNSEARFIVDQGFSVEQLKQSQEAYLLSLGLNFNTPDYFEARLRIGHAHLRAGIRPSLYQCAYRILQQLIIDCIPADHRAYSQLVSFVLKVTTLDMSLAIEAYEESLTESLEYPGAMVRHNKETRDHLARIDPLTQTLSRSAILEVLEKKLAAASGTIPVTVMLVELVNLRDLNEELGHVLGDQVLQRIADRISAAIRTVNAVGRFGGNQFLVVLHNTPLEEARNIAHRLKDKLYGRTIKIEDVVVDIRIHIGIAHTLRVEAANVLVSRAQKCLIQATDRTKNTITVAEEPRDPRSPAPASSGDESSLPSGKQGTAD